MNDGTIGVIQRYGIFEYHLGEKNSAGVGESTVLFTLDLLHPNDSNLRVDIGLEKGASIKRYEGVDGTSSGSIETPWYSTTVGDKPPEARKALVKRNIGVEGSPSGDGALSYGDAVQGVTLGVRFGKLAREVAADIGWFIGTLNRPAPVVVPPGSEMELLRESHRQCSQYNFGN
jgi:hypothetical protein